LWRDSQITLADIQAASLRIAPYVRETPVTPDRELSARLAGPVWLKWENRQTTGSFKLRGALNKLLALPPDAQPDRVVAASAGNHGQGVAYAARLVGWPVTVYVPEAATRKKVEAMRALGAEVRFVVGGYGDAEAAAIAAARESGALWVSPYNDPSVIAGQGTLGLELIAQAPDLDLVLVPVGGGGLIAGVGLAIKALKPGVRVIGIQSEASPFLHAEFHGQDMAAVVERPTLADGLAGPVEPGSITVPLLHQVADDVLLISEADIAQAIAYAYRTHGEIVEGSGAVGLAALLSGRVDCAGRTVGVIISGGNIDPERLDQVLAAVPSS
jgi:threonine dehydratase